jgi:DNA modification methylase
MDEIICGDTLPALKTIPDESVDCVVTSPPYWALRDYGVKGQLGLEPSFHEYIEKLCDIFDEVRRVLKTEGTCWVNVGDTYYTKSGSNFKQSPAMSSAYAMRAGLRRANELRGRGLLPEKCLVQIPSRFAIEMTNRGWILRNEIIWWKPNCIPTSVKDRFTSDFEKLFFFVKSRRYWFEPQYEPYADASEMRYRQALRARRSYATESPYRLNTPYRYKSGQGAVQSRGSGPDHLVVGGDNPRGRNKRTVWRIPTRPFRGAHFAVFPPELIATPIRAGCPEFVCKKCGKPRTSGGDPN